MKTTTAMEAFIFVAVAATLGAGCNAAFGINEGRPWPRCTTALMIDDMEDHDGAICETNDAPSRHGSWFTASDGSSDELQPAVGQPFVPSSIPGGRDGSRYAARMTGAGFTGWGALMGFNLNVQGLANRPYNASAVGGIKFWMKSNVPVTVDFPMEGTIPANRGGTCSDGAQAFNCDNHFSFSISAPVPDQWIEYDVPFSALAQTSTIDAQGNEIFGSVAWNPASLVGIQFATSRPQFGVLDLSFAVWVDDIQFYGCLGATCVPTCTDPRLPVACPSSGTTPARCWPEGSACGAVSVLDTFFAGLGGSAANDVWTVGGSTSTGAAAIAHWNGVAWSISSGPAGAAPLASVWSSDPADVWAVGDRGTTVRWNGSSWSDVASATTASLASVWGSAADDVWAVGHGGTIQHWNGVAWSKVASPTTHWLSAVWGSGPSDVWAVGFSETDQTSVIIHWDGSRWAVVPNGAPLPLVDVWSSGQADAWAVGFGIVHWNGSSWTSVPSPADATQVLLGAVWGGGRDDVWAVGSGGTTLHWTGASWSIVPSGTTQDLYRVWGSGPNDVWAAGARGTLLHWTGAAWSVVPASAIR
jgi:hypothetical protein